MPRHAMTPHFSGCTIDAQVIPLMFQAWFTTSQNIEKYIVHMMCAQVAACGVVVLLLTGQALATWYALSIRVFHFGISNFAKPRASRSAAGCCAVQGTVLHARECLKLRSATCHLILDSSLGALWCADWHLPM